MTNNPIPDVLAFLERPATQDNRGAAHLAARLRAWQAEQEKAGAVPDPVREAAEAVRDDIVMRAEMANERDPETGQLLVPVSFSRWAKFCEALAAPPAPCAECEKYHMVAIAAFWSGNTDALTRDDMRATYQKIRQEIASERDTLKAEVERLQLILKDAHCQSWWIIDRNFWEAEYCKARDANIALRSHLRAALECLEVFPEPEVRRMKDCECFSCRAIYWHSGPRAEMAERLRSVLK